MAPKCPKCSKSVYFAEEVKGLGQSWHKPCFVCSGCKKSLTPGKISDNEGHPFCNPCYSKQFGPKGYGYGGGAGVLNTHNWVSPPQSSSPPKPSESFTKSSQSTSFCSQCKTDRSGKFCTQCGSQLGSPPVKTPTSRPLPQQPRTSKFGGGVKCARCSKTVYDAEKVLAIGKTFHKQCMRCASCQSSVDTNTVNDREGEIYCKICYGKNFGPKGYGYGVGAGTLTQTE